MKQYMLLLHDNTEVWSNLSPEEMQKVIERYVAWNKKLKKTGLMAGGKKLADEPGKVMRMRASKLKVTDGPYSEGKEVLGGFFLVKASNYKAAVALAADCPHLDYGGAIEVREVDAIHE
jgi:hypothetical protein